MDTTYMLEMTLRYGGHSNFVFETYDMAKEAHDKIAASMGDRYSNDPEKNRVYIKTGEGEGTVDPSEVSVIRIVDKAAWSKLAAWVDGDMLAMHARMDENLAKVVGAAVSAAMRAV